MNTRRPYGSRSDDPWQNLRKPGGARRMRPPPSRREIERDAAEAEELLIRARVSLESGDLGEARSLAGEAVLLTPRSPEGFLIIADAQAAEGELDEAFDAYQRAERKAQRQGSEAAEFWREAVWGCARINLLLERLEAAAGDLRRLLAELEDQPSGVVQLLAEVYLRLGHPQRALEVVPDGEGRAEAHLLRALAFFDLERDAEAICECRLAFFHNLYLVAAVHGDEAPDHGLSDDAGLGNVEEAEEFGERLRRWFDARPEMVDRVVAVACLPGVIPEVRRAIEIGRLLGQALSEGEQQGLEAELATLRDPERIRVGSDELLSQLREDERDEEVDDPFPV